MELSFLEKLYLKQLLKQDFDLRRKQLVFLTGDEKDITIMCVKEYKQRDLNLLKKLCNENEFVCEICGEIKDKTCEGADPNTCRDCNPERLEVRDDAE